ncbi:MAG: hypothetical protein N2V77_02950 [Canidatus Methanoxibalbensis ujae]|nr:hypothetical protein [Candidatus Methanoxibalbensis ujae]
MEILERINSLEKEIKTLKGEVKKVLVDLRESMNLLENPFANLEHLRAVSGDSGTSIDEERLRHLEKTVEQLKEMLLENGKLEQMEREIEQLKEHGVHGRSDDAAGSGKIDEIRSEIDELKEMINAIQNETGESAAFAEKLGEIERMKDEFEQLKSLFENDWRNRLKNLEEEITALKERLTTSAEESEDVGKIMTENVTPLKEAAKSAAGDDMAIGDDMAMDDMVDDMTERSSAGDVESYASESVRNFDEMRDDIAANAADALTGRAEAREAQEAQEAQDNITGVRHDVRDVRDVLHAKRSSGGEGIMDMLTLSHLMQWADRTINMIGREKMMQILDLYEMSGHLSEEKKRIILKIADIPDVQHEKGRVETKFCILAMYDLDRILTGRHQELFTLLKDIF